MEHLTDEPPLAVDFEEFVHATAPALQRAAVLLCRDPHLAEDLVQTTYTKLFAAWRRVRRTDSPMAYARTVLLRTFLSHRRKRSSEERPSAELPDAPVTDAGDVRRLDLLDALAALSPGDRAVVVLRYWEDLSVAETADTLNLSLSAVRTRSSRALARLRTRFPDLED